MPISCSGPLETGPGPHLLPLDDGPGFINDGAFRSRMRKPTKVPSGLDSKSIRLARMSGKGGPFVDDVVTILSSRPDYLSAFRNDERRVRLVGIEKSSLDRDGLGSPRRIALHRLTLSQRRGKHDDEKRAKNGIHSNEEKEVSD